MIRTVMMGILSISVALLDATVQPAQAALVFSGAYDEDFDSLGVTGTTLPPGWSAVRSGGSGTLGAELSPGVTTGTANSGGIYNTGTANDSDRALGSLASGSTVPAFGVQLINATGAVIDSLLLGATMEQWRSGSSATVVESVLFEYSLNAASLIDPAAFWTPFPAFDLEEQLTTSTTAGAVDGNLAANQSTLSGELLGLNWSDSGTLTLRWSDSDHAGSDGLYALDNLSIHAPPTSVPEPASAGTLLLGLGSLALYRRLSNRRKAQS